MNTIAKREYIVVGVLIGILLASIIPSLFHARREYRDGTRRMELVQFKTQMEQQNNELGYYPAQFNANPHQFVVTKGDGQQALAWFLRAELENKAEESAGFDFEHNVYYRVVQAEDKTFYEVCGGESTCGAERF